MAGWVPRKHLGNCRRRITRLVTGSDADGDIPVTFLLIRAEWKRNTYSLQNSQPWEIAVSSHLAESTFQQRHIDKLQACLAFHPSRLETIMEEQSILQLEEPLYPQGLDLDYMNTCTEIITTLGQFLEDTIGSQY